MPLTAPKHFTNTGLSGAVTSPPFDSIFGTSAESAQWVDTGSPQGVVVDFSGITDSSGTKFLVLEGAGDSTHLQMTFRFRLTDLPAAAVELLHVRTDASGKISNLLATVSGGTVSVRVRGMSDAALTGWTTGTALTLGTWYMLRLHVTTGTNTVTYAELRTADGGTLLASGNLSSPTASSGDPWAQFGKFSGTAVAPWQIDDIAVHDAAGAFIDPAEDLTVPDDEEPAGSEIIHTFTGRTPGAEIGTSEFPNVFGDPARRVYGTVHGSVAARFFADNEQGGYVEDTFTAAQDLSVAFEVTVDEFPSANIEIFTPRTSAGRTASLVLTTAGTLRLNTGDGATNILATPALELGEAYEVRIAVRADDTDGKIKGAISKKDGDVLLVIGETTDLNTGASGHVSYRLGKVTTSASSVDFYIDNLRAVVGGYGYIDPAVEVGWAGPDLTLEPPTEPIVVTAQGPGAWSQVDGPAVDWAADGAVLTIQPPAWSFDPIELGFDYGGDALAITILPCSSGRKPAGSSSWVPTVRERVGAGA